ncbi:MAG: hypothetical protein IJT29_03835 [Oscillospiraceae bacterium]|nr:hypothetical protein [Oscillospiraceae bacterium]
MRKRIIAFYQLTGDLQDIVPQAFNMPGETQDLVSATAELSLISSRNFKFLKNKNKKRQACHFLLTRVLFQKTSLSTASCAEKQHK